MSSKNDKIPFIKYIQHVQKLYDISFESAVDKAQTTYEKFLGRNLKFLEKQNEQANATQVQLISHFALLATLTLTVLGFLITQTAQRLTNGQQKVVLLTICIEIASLFFGAIDYVQTIRFHQRWARLYLTIDKEAQAKFGNGELQWASDLAAIESKHVKKLKDSTDMRITYAMVFLCLLGLLTLALLFYAYFFNVPLIK